MFSNSLVILMTAAVFPQEYSDAVFVSDPQQRAEQYAKALEFWIHFPDPRIIGVVFCDNSTTDHDLVKSYLPAGLISSSRPVEWLGFIGNDRPPGLHYGYAELGQIDYAVRFSKILASTEYFIKTTGRLTFPRISKLLDAMDEAPRICIDFRQAYSGEGGPPARARTQLMLINREFYEKRLINRRDEMLKCCSHIEEFLALILLRESSDPRVHLRFKIECPPIGVSGATGQNYGSIRQRLKSHMRGLIRRMKPDLWL